MGYIGRDYLLSGSPDLNYLNRGQYLLSSNGIYELNMQHDGNLVVYKMENGIRRPLWATGTNGASEYTRGYFCFQQDSGCLDVFNFQVNLLWSSQSTQNPGYAPYKLIMQNDGNLVIYNKNNVPVWASNTVQN